MTENSPNQEDQQKEEVPKKNTPNDSTILKGKTLVERLISYLNFSVISYIVTIIVFTVPFALIVYPISILAISDKIQISIIFWLIVSFLYILVLLLTKVTSSFWEKKTIEKDISNLYEQLEKKNFFTTLIRINFKYIDKYYLQTQVQADKSFYLSVTAAIVSLIMIIAGIILLFTDTEGKKVTPAYVTVIAGVLGEFISTVFFYLYNRTVSEMSNYHQKLVLTQNISLAMRLAEGLDDKEAKSKALATLIECLTKDINMYLTMQVSKTIKETSTDNKIK